MSPPSTAHMDDRVVVTNTQRVCAIAITSFILYYCRVPQTMVSEDVNRSVLVLSALCFALFCFMGIFTTVHFSRKNLRWFEEHQRFLHIASAIGLLSGVLWIVGMWPALHGWSVPLWLIIVVLLTNLSGLSFHSTRRHPKKV